MAGIGQPRRFPTEEHLYQEFVNYMRVCYEAKRLPNIAGFCVYCDMTRQCWYEQKALYPYTFKKLQEMLEDGALNAEIAPAVKIFYLKNKFSDSYKDKIENHHTGEMVLDVGTIEKYLKDK